MAAPNRPLWLDVSDSPYSNNGNWIASLFFLAIIAASLACCLAVTWKTPRFFPFSLVLSITCIFEVTAYALRLQDWHIVTYTTNFGLSVIAPVFLTIGIHYCAAQVLRVLGTEHAVLSPNAHMRVFIWSDILAGLLQAIGLGLTFSRAEQSGFWGITLPKEAGTGQAIIYAGLLLQTLMLAVALVLLVIAYVKAGKADRQYGYTTFHTDGAGYVPLSPRFKTFLVVLPLAGVCVLVRCGYRSAAVWGGIGSPIAMDQLLWLVAEGVMLTEAIATLAVFHPAIWLDDGSRGRVQGDVTEQDGTRTSKLGKRQTVGTFATGITDLERGNVRDSRQDLGEISQVMFSTNLIAPSEVSSEGSPSRRGSTGGHAYEPVTGHTTDMMVSSPYDPHLPPVRRYSLDITAESRALSPLEAEEEADRISVIPEPPRKSSKRISRALETARLEQQKRDEEEEDDRLEVVSVILPPRMPSTRDPNRGYSREDDLEDVAIASTYSQSLYSQ